MNIEQAIEDRKEYEEARKAYKYLIKQLYELQKQLAEELADIIAWIILGGVLGFITVIFVRGLLSLLP